MTHFAFERAMGLLLLVLTVILSLIMIHSPGTDDVAAFLYWTEVVYQNGLAAGYTKVIDDPIIGDLHYFYPPLSFAILYIARAFGNAVALSPLISFKVMILTFQLVSAGIILLLSGSYSVAAAFNASLLLSGVGLGYMDVCVAPPLILAFWAFQSKRNVLGTALFLIACLIKWQPLVLVPFIGIYLFQISDLRSWRDAVGGLLFWKIVILVSATIALLSLLFGFAPERALGYAMKCGFLSGNALNVPWVADFFYKFLFSHSFSPQAELGASTPGSMYLLPFRTIFWIIFGVVLMRAISSEGSFGNFLLFAIVGFLTYIMWNSGVHENHLFCSGNLSIHVDVV